MTGIVQLYCDELLWWVFYLYVGKIDVFCKKERRINSGHGMSPPPWTKKLHLFPILKKCIHKETLPSRSPPPISSHQDQKTREMSLPVRKMEPNASTFINTVRFCTTGQWHELEAGNHKQSLLLLKRCRKQACSNDQDKRFYSRGFPAASLKIKIKKLKSCSSFRCTSISLQ